MHIMTYSQQGINKHVKDNPVPAFHCQLRALESYVDSDPMIQLRQAFRYLCVAIYGRFWAGNYWHNCPRHAIDIVPAVAAGNTTNMLSGVYLKEGAKLILRYSEFPETPANTLYTYTQVCRRIVNLCASR